MLLLLWSQLENNRSRCCKYGAKPGNVQMVKDRDGVLVIK